MFTNNMITYFITELLSTLYLAKDKIQFFISYPADPIIVAKNISKKLKSVR